MHMKIKEMLKQYHALPENKKEHVWEVMEEYYEKLPDCVKKEMGYKLAVEVYGDKLTDEEAETVVSKMFGHGDSGKHWTLDEVRSFARTKDVDFAKTHFSLGDLYAMMHAKYYDQYDFLRSLTSSDAQMAEYCFKLAKGYLDDEDAPEHGEGKARKYFCFVV